MSYMIADIFKETLIVLSCFEDSLIEKIPKAFLTKLNNEAAESKLEICIDKNINLSEQNISEESKNLISLIYYNYIATEGEKELIKKSWNDNEKNLNEQFDFDKIFEDKLPKNDVTKTFMIERKKETIFDKIRKIFRKH